MRVLLITTGVMEERALPASLRRCFPDHEFVPHPRLDGFTSAQLPPDFAGLTATQRLLLNIDKFARALIGAFAPGGRADRTRPDLVFAFEDIELVNADAPGRITRTLRDAVARNLAAWPLDGTARSRVSDALRERCSFHLMSPMTEAHFFADPAALARATDPGPDHPCRFDPTACDIEAFVVDDERYLADPIAPDPRPAWRKDGRRRHPKHYLEFLTDPQLDGRFRYHETSLGGQALAELDWPRILSRTDARDPPAARFARSLFTDLSEALAASPRGCTDADLEPRDCHPLTWPPPRDHVLRNL